MHTISIILTQMISKGLDFPLVTLVGIVMADISLNLPDFRAAERTFQLLTQVAGRSGRRDKAGEVIIQTYNPQHYAIESASQQNYIRFATEELGYRKKLYYPPLLPFSQNFVSKHRFGNPEKRNEQYERSPLFFTQTISYATTIITWSFSGSFQQNQFLLPLSSYF